MAQDQLIELPWPKGGFVENNSQSEQPALTTTDCLNVRNFDSLDRRNRGGQRSGMTNWLPGTVNGSNSIQSMTQVAIAFDSNLVVADTVLQPDSVDATKTDTFAYSDGALETVSSSKWETYEPSSAGNVNFLFGTKVNNSESMTANDSDLTAPQLVQFQEDFRCAALTSKPALGTAYILKYELEIPEQPASASGRALFAWRMLDDPENSGGGGSFSGYHFQITRNAGSGTVNLDALFRKTVPGAGTTTLQTNNAFDTTNSDPYTATVEIIVNGNIVTIIVNSVTIVDAFTMTELSGQGHTGVAVNISVGTGAAVDPARISELTYSTGLLPASKRTTKFVVVSGGSVFTGDKSGVTVAGSGTSIFATDVPVVLQPAFQKVYMSDGLVYKILDPRTNTVSDWQTSLTAGALPVGGNGTTQSVTAVNTGTPSFTVAEDLSTTLSAGDFIEIRNSTGNDGAYTVASTSGTGPTVITVDQAIQDATADGILVKGNLTAGALALFRGRVVATLLESQPHNIYMPRVADPLDWNYFPTVTDRIQPVASHVTDTFGTLGDVITAFATYTDDMAIIGMANSLAVLRGDPAAGGQIDHISDKIGIVGPEAWTFDTGGNFYFMGVNGLYKMDLASFKPVLLSQNRLDKTFSDINTAAKRVQLEYDPKWQGVHILIKSQVQQTTTKDRHWFWDERNDAFLPDEYPLVVGPLSAWRWTADNPEENAMLFGTFDGQVLAFDDDATDDDGAVIPSHCRFTPVTPGDILTSSRLHDINVLLDNDSDPVTLKVYSGDSAESAEANADAGTPVRVKRTLKGGRNSSSRQRISQNTHIIELSQSGNAGSGATWAFEKALARVAVLSRMKGKGV